MDWLMAHWIEVTIVAGIALPIAHKIAKKTSNKYDDIIVEGIREAFNKLRMGKKG